MKYDVITKKKGIKEKEWKREDGAWKMKRLNVSVNISVNRLYDEEVHSLIKSLC